MNSTENKQRSTKHTYKTKDGVTRTLLKNKQRSTKHTHKTKDRVKRTPIKAGGELMSSGRVSSYCSTCRKHFPVLSSFTTYCRVCNQIIKMGATSGAGTAYPSGAPELTPGFQWGSCYSIFSFICMFCRSLFVFSKVRVTRSLVLYVCFADRCLSFCTFSFGHCVVCSSSIYGF